MMYTPTPDYYNEYIQHGYLKDQAAKVHKYIKRWRNAAGKWVYQYKKKVGDKIDDIASAYGGVIPEAVHKIQNVTNKKYKIQRKNRVLAKHDKLSYGYNKGTLPYYSGFERRKQIKQARKNAASSKSAMKSDPRYKRSKTNLTSQGYSGSRGNKINNRATTGQRGSRLNSGIAAGRKRTNNGNNKEKRFVSSKTNSKANRFVNSKTKNSKAKKFVGAKTKNLKAKKFVNAKKKNTRTRRFIASR